MTTHKNLENLGIPHAFLMSSHPYSPLNHITLNLELRVCLTVLQF